jgi:DNA-binding NarL/FixJ family response regulator
MSRTRALVADGHASSDRAAARAAHNKQMASVLGISEIRVKRHVQNTLQKLNPPSRQVAGRLA